MNLEQLDRRIAEEVMGEPKPAPPSEDTIGENMGVIGTMERSEGGSWRVVQVWEHGDEPEWVPVNFSSDMDLAMRAADKVLKNRPVHDRMRLDLSYYSHYYTLLGAWNAVIVDTGGRCQGNGQADTAPEAVCHAVLAFVGKK